MSEAQNKMLWDETCDVGDRTLPDLWQRVRFREWATLAAFVVTTAGMAATVAYSRRTEEINLLRQQVVNAEGKAADLEERLKERENPLGDPDAGSGTACPDRPAPGPPRVRRLIESWAFTGWFRWTIIEIYRTGWSKRNGEERFLALEAAFDALKEEATRKGFLWQEYVIRGLFDKPEEREAITRLYAEFHEIDMALTAALQDRDPEQTCTQLAKWRTSNAEYMLLASRRLVELVRDAFLQPSTGAPCLIDQ